MKNQYIFLIMIIGVWMFSSCSNFLKEYSQNQAYVEHVSDLDELLIGAGYFPKDPQNGYDPVNVPLTGNWTSLAPGRFVHHFVMDDDIAEHVAGIESDNPAVAKGSNKDWIRYQAASAFYWQPDPYLDHQNLAYSMNSWSDYYTRIAAMNSVLFQLDELRTGEDTLELRVEGEARFLRATYFFMLVNAYAQPYNKQTASSDLGVPVKTTEVIEDRFFARNTVQEVYDLMTSDLERSVECLRHYHPFARKVRTNYVAASTLLSRVYLYMEEYEKAIAYADTAILSPYFSLQDLNGFDPADNFASQRTSEVLFTQRGSFMAELHQNDSINGGDDYVHWGIETANGYMVSEDLLKCYDANDLRKNIFFVPKHYGGAKGAYRCLKYRTLDADVVGEDCGLRLAEAYLNKAEALAILGKEAEAKSVLRELQLKRYAAGTVPEVSQSGADLVNYIRDERRRELCYEGHRWFDLRRYAVNSKYPYTKAIEHLSYEYIPTTETTGSFRIAGKYVLKPYPEDKEAYVLPLPDYAVLFNEGVLEQNPERPERPIQPID